MLADVAGDGSVPSLWDLLWPVLGWACLSVLVAVPVAGLLVAHLMNLVARHFYRPFYHASRIRGKRAPGHDACTPATNKVQQASGYEQGLRL